jgi:hypothetical protein
MVIGGTVLLLLGIAIWLFLKGTLRLVLLCVIALLIVSLPFIGVR